MAINNLTHPKVVALLQQHLDDMYATSPAESVHALDLETGSQIFFQPAIDLYKTYGFEFCRPFAHYEDDHNSKFMTLALGSAD